MGWDVELMKYSRLPVIDILCIDAGLRAFERTKVLLLLLLEAYRLE